MNRLSHPRQLSLCASQTGAKLGEIKLNSCRLASFTTLINKDFFSSEFSVTNQKLEFS